MTRTRRLARLPRHIRGQLNARMDGGEEDQPLLGWLNHQPEVQALANGQPGGSPVTEQDLSEWKQAGYQQWLRHQEACDVVRDLAEQADDLESSAEDVPISDCLSAFLGTELARSAKSLLAESTAPGERWQRLREVLQEGSGTEPPGRGGARAQDAEAAGAGHRPILGAVDAGAAGSHLRGR